MERSATSPPSRGLLDRIERLGNALPSPAMLFVVGSLLIMALSQVGTWMDWSVQPKRLEPVTTPVIDRAGVALLDPVSGVPVVEPVLDARGRPVLELVPDLRANGGEPIKPRSLLTANGLYYAISKMVDNFIAFPPLGVVLVGVMGVGVAERTGLIGALLKALMLAVPARLLTPTVVFLGIMSSLATDAGYIVLPPLAAGLFKAAGRSPIAGIAAVFAGIAAGFNANLLITSLDPLLAGLTTAGAQVIDPGYRVAPTCNWWFMIASTFVLTGVGWGVSSLLVEPRLREKPASEGGPAPVSEEDLRAQVLTRVEIRGLLVGAGVGALTIGVFLAFALVPGAPFDDGLGKLGDDRFDRWVEAIVPMIFFSFLLPGVAYGLAVRSVRDGKDVAQLMVESMAALAPIIVLAFFAAQFIEYFKYSNLDRMLAYVGGGMLAEARLGPSVLIVAFILVTMAFNLVIASMSAKYAVFAPIFVPMLMMVGISPELTQGAYRIGDSVTNVITPLNAYLIIILVFMQKHAPRAGLGTVISLMVPYTLVFTVVWTILLLLWVQFGLELGPGGPLTYPPPVPASAS